MYATKPPLGPHVSVLRPVGSQSKPHSGGSPPVPPVPTVPPADAPPVPTVPPADAPPVLAAPPADAPPTPLAPPLDLWPPVARVPPELGVLPPVLVTTPESPSPPAPGVLPPAPLSFSLIWPTFPSDLSVSAHPKARTIAYPTALRVEASSILVPPTR